MNILNGIKIDAGKHVNKYKIKFLNDYYIILGILSSNKSSIFDEKIDGVMVREYFNECAYVVFKTTSLSNISKIGYYKFDYNLIASVFFIDDDKEFKNLSDTDGRLLDNYIFIDVDCSKIYKLNNRYDLLEDDLDEREMGIENLTRDRDSVFRNRTFSTKDFYYKIGGFFKKDKTLNRYFNVDILDLLREFCITYNNKGKINTKNSIPSIIKILKDFESRGLFVIFRFKNVTWFELLFAFSRYNIHISGGHPSKRHLLSNIEFVLSLFLVDHHKSSIENLTKQIGFNILSPPDFNSNKLNFILKTLGTKNRKFIGANDPRYRGYLTLYSLLNYGYFLRNKIIDILNNNLFYKLNDYKVPENYMEENDSDIRYQFLQIFSLAENNLPTDLNHRVIFADIKKHIDLIWKLQYIYLTKEPIGINIIKSINVDLNEHLIYFISEYQKILYKLSQLTYYLSYLDSKYSIEMDKLHVNKKKIEPAESLARDKKLEKEIKTFVKTNANLDRSIKNYKNKKLKNQPSGAEN